MTHLKFSCSCLSPDPASPLPSAPWSSWSLLAEVWEEGEVEGDMAAFLSSESAPAAALPLGELGVWSCSEEEEEEGVFLLLERGLEGEAAISWEGREGCILYPVL